MARPTIYSNEMAEKVCSAIASHAMGYGKLSEQYPDLPCEATIQNWIHKYPEFLGPYIQAKEAQAFLLLDKTIDIANRDQYEEDSLLKVNRDKLKIDTYKFDAVKLNHKQFGDKKETSNTHHHTVEEVNRTAEKINKFEQKY